MKLRTLFGLIISLALLAMFGCGGDGGVFIAAVPQFTITASASAGGTITPSGAVAVTQGAGQTFTITPTTGFLSDVLVDGVSQGAVTTYTFTNVTANHTISAVFAAGLPTMATVKLSTGGTLPFGNLIGTIEAVMTYPQDVNVVPPVPPAVVPTITPLVTPVSVAISGVALAGGFIFPQEFPGITQNPDYYPLYATTAVGTVAMTLRYPDPLTPTGITTGEFATVTFNIAQPTDPALPRFIPTAASFGKERGFTLLNLSNQVIFGTSDSNFIVGPVIFQ